VSLLSARIHTKAEGRIFATGAGLNTHCMAKVSPTLTFCASLLSPRTHTKVDGQIFYHQGPRHESPGSLAFCASLLLPRTHTKAHSQMFATGAGLNTHCMAKVSPTLAFCASLLSPRTHTKTQSRMFATGAGLNTHCTAKVSPTLPRQELQFLFLPGTGLCLHKSTRCFV